MKHCLFSLFTFISFISCTSPQNKDRFELVEKDDFLSFQIDDDVIPPKFCLWTFKDNGKEYLSFPNQGDEVIVYDLETQQLVKKIHYQKEGENGVGNIYSFYPVDFNHIYIANTSLPEVYLTDSAGRINDKIILNEMENGGMISPVFLDVITYRPMYIFNDSIYFSQMVNPSLGYEYWKHSPVGLILDKKNHKIIPTPLVYHRTSENENLYQPTGIDGGKVSGVFNGESFVYSFNFQDSIYQLSRNFKKITKVLAKSKYIEKVNGELLPSDSDLEQIIKRTCELPAYGNIIYDPYREVYYRFAFPAVKMNKERSYMDIYHSGRKQFSIIILDKNLNVVGETLFHEYTYNPYLLFVRENGLYLCASHFKRTDYNENVLRFQRIELVKRSN